MSFLREVAKHLSNPGCDGLLLRNAAFDKSFAQLLQGKTNLKFSLGQMDLIKRIRPFHRQAKGRPVANPLSRVMPSVDSLFYSFTESTPLTKSSQHAHLAACRKQWSGVIIV